MQSSPSWVLSLSLFRPRAPQLIKDCTIFVLKTAAGEGEDFGEDFLSDSIAALTPQISVSGNSLLHDPNTITHNLKTLLQRELNIKSEYAALESFQESVEQCCVAVYYLTENCVKDNRYAFRRYF